MNYINQQIFDENIAPSVLDGFSSGEAVATRPDVRKWPISYHSIATATVILDVMTITFACLSACIGYDLYQGMHVDFGKPVGLAALVSVLFCLVLNSQGLYSPMELLRWRRQLRLVFATWAIIFLLLSGVVFALKIGSSLSRGTNMLFAGLGLVSLVANRLLVRELLTVGLAQRRFSGRKIVLISDPDRADPALDETLAATGFNVTGHFALPHPGVSFALQKRLARSVVEHIRGTDIEEIIVASDPNRWSDSRTLAAELRMLPFPITFMPVGATAEIFRRPSHDIGGTVCVELQRGPLSRLEHAIKRSVDVIAAGLVLILLFPLLALVTIAIKLDSPGPVLFRQQRLGFNGRTFNICKFRTMSVLEDGLSVVQARAGDDRITRVGRWLRRTSVDELPQLFNVLGGSMSLVGPRPHALAHDNQFDKLVRNYGFRQRVKPGLTGWAQINGYRGPTPTTDLIERRVEYDLWYIENWSLRLDLTILLQTPWEVVRGRNAY
jgi:putative colanic acid biosynthesis UDP-glucose lipid carrier transferase